jgi:hypothetical protein
MEQFIERGRYVRRACSSLVFAVMLVPFLGAASQVAELRPGAYVRIRAPGVLGGEAEGAIVSRGHDTVVVVRPGAMPVAIPLAAITRASVLRGRTRGAGARKGAKWGAGVGLGLGLFNIVFSDCSGEHCQTSDNVAGVAVFTAVSAGVGAVVGTVVRAEKWERIELSRGAVSQPAATTLGWSAPR